MKINRILALSLLLATGASALGQNNTSNMTNDKTLVAYFSWSNNTATMAKYIAEKTGADLFRIERVEPYPEDYNACADEAKKEVDNDIYPAIKGVPKDFDSYSTVFVAVPVWWYTAPMPVRTFLEKSGLSWEGKTIIPFCTAYTAEYNSLKDIVKATPAAQHKAGLAVITQEMGGKNLAGKEAQVDKWLKELGF